MPRATPPPSTISVVRPAQQAQGGLEAAGIGRRSRRLEWLGLELGRYFGQQVFAQRDDHRTRSTGHGQTRPAQGQLAESIGSRRLDRPLGNRPEGVRQLGFLEGFAVPVGRRNLAEQREHRARILMRGMNPDGEVAAADHARTHAHGGTPSEFAERLGHEGGAALVSGGDHTDAGCVIERIEQAEKALAGDAKGVTDARGQEGLDHGLAARTGHRV